MFSDMTGVNEPGSVIEHIVEDSFFDEFFEFGVFLFCDLVWVFDTGVELEVVLEETVGGSLSGFDLTFHDPVSFAGDFSLESVDLILKVGFGFLFCL